MRGRMRVRGEMRVRFGVAYKGKNGQQARAVCVGMDDQSDHRITGY